MGALYIYILVKSTSGLGPHFCSYLCLRYMGGLIGADAWLEELWRQIYTVFEASMKMSS